MAALRPAPLGRASPRVVAVAVASRGGPTRLRAARGRRQRPTPAAQADAIVAPRTRSNQTGPAVHGRRYHPAGERPVGLLEAQPLSRYCSWAIGGPARYLLEVQDVESLSAALRWAAAQQLAVWVVGRGSNSLFDDRGFDGLVVVNEMDFVEDLGGGLFRFGSGCHFNKLGLHTAGGAWSGLEFACGIPGTLGGAMYMNSGADGQDIGSVLVCAEVMHADGQLETWHWQPSQGGAHKPGFGYRRSPFQRLPKSSVIVAATCQLQHDRDALARAHDSLARRRASQPLASKSAGCVFRNASAGPGQADTPAGLLIDRLGLKGAAQGGAMVSPQHANFLINRGTCSADDMRGLIAFVKQQVEEKTGIRLQEEICVVPYSAGQAAAETL
eukprot:jgi/Tetstr1/421926/TSEL_012825.t1